LEIVERKLQAIEKRQRARCLQTVVLNRQVARMFAIREIAFTFLVPAVLHTETITRRT
jgi:hypothetical protein